MAKNWRFKYKSAKKMEAQREFEDWSSENFIDHILELRSTIGEMELVIEELRTGNDSTDGSVQKREMTEDHFKQVWSYPTKIAFFLHLLQKPLTSEDLHNLLLKSDRDYRDYNSPRNNLTVSLNRAVKSGRIKKIKVPGIRTLYYVLPEWTDKEGKVKDEFISVFNQFHYC